MGQEPNNQAPPRDSLPEGSSEQERRDSLRQYLIGDLSEQEQERIERRLISQDDYFEELLIAEEELADDFVGGRLPEAERAKFRRHFLPVPELRQEVTFAKALRMHAAEHARRAAPQSQAERPPPLLLTLTAFLRRPAVGFSLAAALLLAVCAAIWMAAQNSRLRARVEQLQASATPTPATTPQTGLLEELASERERGAQLATQLSKEQEQRAEAELKLEEARRQQPRPRIEQSTISPVVALFTLSPSIVRGPGVGMKRVSAPPGGGRVLVRLDLAADNYPTYRATLKTVEGKELLSLSNLRALSDGGSKAVVLILPAVRLAPGNDYQILLSGKSPNGGYEDVGTYNFRVVR
ncbi:MAG: hypothetical protein WCD76_05105 [Pyrinomonadaceae bacterium]